MARSDPQFKLRIPVELKEKTEKSAKKSRRSITAWINIAIEEKLTREQKEATA